MSCKSIDDLGKHENHTITLSRDKGKVIIECQTCWEVLLELTDKSENIFKCPGKEKAEETV